MKKSKQHKTLLQKISKQATYSIVLFFVLLVTAVIAITQILNSSNFDLRQQAADDPGGGGGLYAPTNTPTPVKLANGQLCQTHSQCQSNYCADGFCQPISNQPTATPACSASTATKAACELFAQECIPDGNCWKPKPSPTATTCPSGTESKTACEKFGDSCELYNNCWRPKQTLPTSIPTRTPTPSPKGIDQLCSSNSDCQSGLTCQIIAANIKVCKQYGSGGGVPTATPTPKPACQSQVQCQKYGDICTDIDGCWQVAKLEGNTCSRTVECATGLLCANNICTRVSQVEHCYSFNNCQTAGPPCVCIETSRNSQNSCSANQYFTRLDCQLDADYYNNEIFKKSCTTGSTVCIADTNGNAVSQSTCNSDGKTWSVKACSSGQICKDNKCYSPSSLDCQSKVQCQKYGDVCVDVNGCWQIAKLENEFCNSREKCATGLTCLDSFCQKSGTVPKCYSLNDCRTSGKTCNCIESERNSNNACAAGQYFTKLDCDLDAKYYNSILPTPTPPVQSAYSTASQCASNNGNIFGCRSLSGCIYDITTHNCSATYGKSSNPICSVISSGLCAGASIGSACNTRNNTGNSTDGLCARNTFADTGDTTCVCEAKNSISRVEVSGGNTCPANSWCICMGSGSQIQPGDYCPHQIGQGVICPPGSPHPGCWCNLPLGKLVSPGEMCYNTPQEVAEFFAEGALLAAGVASMPYVLPTTISVGSSVVPAIGQAYLQGSIIIASEVSATATVAGATCAQSEGCQKVAATVMNSLNSVISTWTSSDPYTAFSREVLKTIIPGASLIDPALGIFQQQIGSSFGIGFFSTLHQQQSALSLANSVSGSDILVLNSDQYNGGRYGSGSQTAPAGQLALPSGYNTSVPSGLPVGIGTDLFAGAPIPIGAAGIVGSGMIGISPGFSIPNPLGSIASTVERLSNNVLLGIADVILPDPTTTKTYNGVTSADIAMTFQAADEADYLTILTPLEQLHRTITKPTQMISRGILTLSARLNPVAIEDAIDADVVNPNSPNPIHNTAYGTHARTTGVLTSADDPSFGENLTLVAVQTHAENLAAGDYRGIPASTDQVSFMIIDESGGRIYSVPQDIAQRPDSLRTYLGQNPGISVSPEVIAKTNEVASDPNRGLNYGDYLLPEDFDERPIWKKGLSMLSGQAPPTVVDQETLDLLNNRKMLTIDLTNNSERINPGVGALTVGIQNTGESSITNVYTLNAHDRIYGAGSQNNLTEVVGRLGVNGYQQTNAVPINTDKNITITTSPGVVTEMNERIQAQRQAMIDRGYTPEYVTKGLSADTVFADTVGGLYNTDGQVVLALSNNSENVAAYSVLPADKVWAFGLATEWVGQQRIAAENGQPDVVNTAAAATNIFLRDPLSATSRFLTPNLFMLTSPKRLLSSRSGVDNIFETVTPATGVSLGTTFNSNDSSATANIIIANNATGQQKDMQEWLLEHPEDLERMLFAKLDQIDQALGINTRPTP